MSLNKQTSSPTIYPLLPPPSSLKLPIIRAALDIGSSNHKLSVALIHPPNSNSLSHPAPTILHQAAIRVPLADSFSNSHDQNLPPHILSSSLAAIRTLTASAITHGATQFAAIATQVFRVAHNGRAHLNQIEHVFGIQVKILSSMEEGQLAFWSVLASHTLNHIHHTMSFPDLVVWDSGGASSQWTHIFSHSNTYGVHALPVGSSSVRAAHRTLKYISSLREWVRSNATDIHDVHLKAKLRTGNVVGLGGPTSMFALASVHVGSPVFTSFHVQQVFDQVQEKDRENVLPKLVLLAELMDAYSIARVTYMPLNGSCLGLLASRDKYFWGENLSQDNSKTSVLSLPEQVSRSCPV